MTAGLPGTGVGGLFYLLAALLLPLRLAWLRAGGRRERGHTTLVIRQLAMSVSMIAAVWLTGALLGLWSPLPTIVTIAPIVLTFGTLVVVLIAVEIGRLVIRPPAGFVRCRLDCGAPPSGVFDANDREAPATSRRTDWARSRGRAAAPAGRSRRGREEPPVTRG
jgi:hypothetical protein